MSDKRKSSEVIARALLDGVVTGRSVEQFGLAPFDPAKNTPRDVGLGGPSTEYLATEYDPNGRVMNYPTIWWDKQGNPLLMTPEEAYRQALAYEQATGGLFPRFDSIGQAEVAAQHRSANGGAEQGLLGPVFGSLLGGSKK